MLRAFWNYLKQPDSAYSSIIWISCLSLILKISIVENSDGTSSQEEKIECLTYSCLRSIYEGQHTNGKMQYSFLSANLTWTRWQRIRRPRKKFHSDCINIRVQFRIDQNVGRYFSCYSFQDVTSEITDYAVLMMLRMRKSQRQNC